MSSPLKTPDPSTLQLVINHLAARMVPAAVIHAWLASSRAGADRRHRTPGASAQAGPRTGCDQGGASLVASMSRSHPNVTD